MIIIALIIVFFSAVCGLIFALQTIGFWYVTNGAERNPLNTTPDIFCSRCVVCVHH